MNMKKIAFIIVFSIMSLAFSSCGGLHNQSSIHAKDLISDENISIKINVMRSGNTSPTAYFSVNKSIEELADIIAKSDSSLSVRTYQEKFLLIDTATNFFLIEPVEKLNEDKEDENRYALFAPIATFEINTPTDDYINMYIPYHLIKGVTVQHYPDSENAYPKTIETESYGTIDEFYDFYNKFEQCDVEKETDSLIVKNKKNNYEMRLSFIQNNNSSQVIFSIL